MLLGDDQSCGHSNTDNNADLSQFKFSLLLAYNLLVYMRVRTIVMYPYTRCNSKKHERVSWIYLLYDGPYLHDRDWLEASHLDEVKKTHFKQLKDQTDMSFVQKVVVELHDVIAVQTTHFQKHAHLVIECYFHLL